MTLVEKFWPELDAVAQEVVQLACYQEDANAGAVADDHGPGDEFRDLAEIEQAREELDDADQEGEVDGQLERARVPMARLAAIVAATIRLIELVGPKTWWREEKKSAPTNPPMITEAMTGVGGRPRISEKPIAWGIETRVTVAAGDQVRPELGPGSRSGAPATKGRRTRNMCEPMAATSSVSSVTLSMVKVSYPERYLRKCDLFASGTIGRAF